MEKGFGIPDKDTFSTETRADVFEAQNSYCCVSGCTRDLEDFHHALPNTKPNRERFPLFIQSVLNCRGVCRLHHEYWRNHPELNIAVKIAELWEKFLWRNKGYNNIE